MALTQKFASLLRCFPVLSLSFSFFASCTYRNESSSHESLGQENLQVVTLNTGLLRTAVGDIVPCANSRRDALKTEVFRGLKKPFVLALQEVWEEKDAEIIREEARKLGFYATYHPVYLKGKLTISSEQILDERFHEFTCDTFGRRRGVLETTIHFQNDRQVVLNTHTAFSHANKVNQCHLRQLDEIRKVAYQYSGYEPRKTILLGDFNIGPDTKYHGQKYDPVATLWKPFVSAVSQGYFKINTPKTWVNSNPLVSIPTIFIQIYSLGKSWHEADSTMDHIFTSKDFNIKKSGSFAHERVPLNNCQKEYLDGKGRGYLSDHFGAQALVSSF